MKKHYVLAGLLILAVAPGFAQVKIGASGAPDASAILEVTSGVANNKGLLLPRLTTAQRNAINSPATALMIYNTTANEVQTNIGTPATPVWSTTPTAGWNTTGNAGTDPANNFLGTTDNQPFSIRTNNAEALRVLPDGKVGIGTDSPLVRLQVSDAGEVSVRATSTTNDKISFTMGNHLHGIAKNLTASGGETNDVSLFTNSGPSVPASLYLSANPTISTNVILDQFALKSTGNVGIGTKDPATKLHLNNGGLRIFNGSTPLGNHAIHVINDGGGSSNNDNIVINSFGTSTRPSIALISARGTFAAPANSQAGDNTGNLLFTNRINGTDANEGRIASHYLGDGTTRKSKMSFYVSDSLSMMIDSSHNVGLGRPSPRTKLDVAGGILLARDVNPTIGNGSFFVWSTVRSGIGETEFINYHGTGTGGFRFYDVAPDPIAGTAQFNTNNIAFIAPVTGAYTNVSDMRVKTNVNIINDGLQKVMAMRPVSYDFHSGRTIKNGVVKFTENDQVVKTIGFLAQELAKVVPEAVVIPKDPANELYNVSYATVVPVLTKAIQEQQAEIEQLKAALAVAKADNAALKADVSKISALADRMQQLEASLGANTAGNTTVSK